MSASCTQATYLASRHGHHQPKSYFGTSMRGWPHTRKTPSGWPVQSASPPVTNQHRNEMTYGLWCFSDINWRLLKLNKTWGFNVKLSLCWSKATLRLLGRLSGVTAPQDLNVDSIRKRCQLTLWPLYTSRKTSSYPRSGNLWGGKEKISGIKDEIFECGDGQSPKEYPSSIRLSQNCQRTFNSKIPAPRSKSPSRTLPSLSYNLITTALSGKTKPCHIHHIAPSRVTRRPLLAAAVPHNTNATALSYARPNSWQKLRTGFTSKQPTLQDTINEWTDKLPQSIHADVRTVPKISYCRFLPNSTTFITLWTVGVHQLLFSGYQGLFPKGTATRAWSWPLTSLSLPLTTNVLAAA